MTLIQLFAVVWFIVVMVFTAIVLRTRVFTKWTETIRTYPSRNIVFPEKFRARDVSLKHEKLSRLERIGLACGAFSMIGAFIITFAH